MATGPGRGALRERLLAGAGILGVLLCLLGVFATLGGGTTYSAPRYSSYSTEPDGVRAFHELLQAQGFQPIRIRRSLTQLPREELQGLLFIVEPQVTLGFRGERWVRQVFSPEELGALQSWVREEPGNVVVLLAADVNELHEQLLVVPPGQRGIGTSDSLAEPGETYPVLLPVPELEGVTALPLPPRSTFHVQGSAELLPLAGTPEQPAVLLGRRRNGAYILVADPRPITNEGLRGAAERGRSGDLRFLLNLVALHAGPGGEIYIDEAHHGYAESMGPVAYLRQHGLHHAALQLVLVFLLAVWRLGAAFGRSVPDQPPRPRDLTEHVGAIANVYHRAHLRQEALQVILGGLARELAAQLRLPPGSPAQQVIEELEKIDRSRARRFMALLRRARSVSRYTTGGEFTDLCRSALQLREEVHSGTFSAHASGTGRGGPD